MSSLIIGLGFVSTNLALRLREEGFTVCIVARRSSIKRRSWLASLLRSAGVRVLAYDRLDYASVRDAVERCRPQLVAYTVGYMGGGRRVWEAHVEVWENVLEAVLAREVETIVYFSAAAVAPCKPGPLDESLTPPWAADRSSSYVASKAEGELRGLAYYRERGAPVAIVRPVMVFGPYAYHVEHRLVARLAGLGLAPSIPVDVVPVADVVNAVLAIHRSRLHGGWIIVARPEGFTLADLSCRLAWSRRGRCRRIPLPLSTVSRLSLALGVEGRTTLLALWLRCGWSFRPTKLMEMGFGWSQLDREVEAYERWLYRGSSGP